MEAVVESLIEKLRHIHHDSGYSPMQLRIWAEMHNGGLHPSLEEPPTSSMFVRAGGGQTSKKKMSNTGDSLTHAITQLASALSPNIAPSSSPAVRGSTIGTSHVAYVSNTVLCCDHSKSHCY